MKNGNGFEKILAKKKETEGKMWDKKKVKRACCGNLGPSGVRSQSGYNG